MIWVIFILFSALTRGIGDIFYKKLSFDFSPQNQKSCKKSSRQTEINE